jgi:hypothetical protein
MELLFDHKIQWSASVEQPDMALQNQKVEEGKEKTPFFLLFAWAGRDDGVRGFQFFLLLSYHQI